MTLLADISSGNTGFADVCFLIAVILFAVAVVAETPSVRPAGAPWWRLLVALGLVALALGFLVL